MPPAADDTPDEGSRATPPPAGPHTAPARATIVVLLGAVLLSAAILVVRESPGAVAGALAWVLVLTAPLSLSAWALLDAARRPRWTWAFADRPQVGWMVAIMLTALIPAVGVAVALVYLLRVRRRLAAVEAGRF